MDAMLKRFSEQAPVAVMARLGMQRAIGAEWVNQVFEEHSQTQYTRELLFSTVVELMSLVALGLRPSLHAAAQKMSDLPVSLTALYDKVNRVEPNVVQALVRGSAERLAPVMRPLRQSVAPWLPAGACASSTVTTCPRARSAWRRCAASAVPRYPAIRSSSLTLTPAW